MYHWLYRNIETYSQVLELVRSSSDTGCFIAPIRQNAASTLLIYPEFIKFSFRISFASKIITLFSISLNMIAAAYRQQHFEIFEALQRDTSFEAKTLGWEAGSNYAGFWTMLSIAIFALV